MVEDRLNIIELLGSMPKKSSYCAMFMLALIWELNKNGIVLTFCDHVSYCDSKTVRKNVLFCLLLFSTHPFDHSAYGVRGLNFHCIHGKNV